MLKQWYRRCPSAHLIMNLMGIKQMPTEIDGCTMPKCSMYGIFTNIASKSHPNVG